MATSPLDLLFKTAQNVAKSGKGVLAAKANAERSLQNFGYNAAQGVKQAVTGTGAFRAETGLGIARNTVTGVPAVLKEMFYSPRGYTEEQLAASDPTIRDKAVALTRLPAEIAGGLGGLSTFIPGAATVGGKIADTRVGSAVARAGDAIIEYGRPKSAAEARSLRTADVLSNFIPGVASTKAAKAAGAADDAAKASKILDLSPSPASTAKQQSPKAASQLGPAGTERRVPQSGVPSSDDAVKIQNSNLINVDRLNISDEAKATVARTAEEVRPFIEAKTGTKLTNAQVIAEAEKTGRVMNRAVGAEKTLEWEASMLRARQKLAAAAETGKVDQDYIDNLIAIKTQAADIGRKLQSFSIGADARSVTQKELILDAVMKTDAKIDEVIKAAEGVDFNDLNQATDFYRKFVKPSAMEWVDLVRYNSMLSSPKTHILNAIGGNLPNSLAIAPIQKAVEGGLDWLRATATGTQQERFAGEGAAYVANYFKGLREASTRFGEVLAGKRGFTDVDLRTIPIANKGTAGLAVKTLSVPTKLLEASDQFFTALVEAGEKGASAYRVKKGGKVVGNADANAENTAAYRLFRQEPGAVEQGYILDAVDDLTRVIQMARDPERTGPVVSTIAKFALPFVRTPTNIFKQGIEYSPLGFANLVGNKGGKHMQLAGDTTEQLSKAIVGSAVFAGAATLLTSNRLTWAEPTGDARNDFRAAGMQPYSVKVGDTWLSYQKLPPGLAFPLAMTAAIHNAEKERKADETTTAWVLASIGKYGDFLKDQSYAKGIGELINGEYGIEGIASNYAQQFVPFRALGGWLARLTDDTQRKVNRDAGFIEQQVQLLMMNIPGLSQMVPERVDSDLNPIPNKDRVANAFSPVSFTRQTEDQEWDYGSRERAMMFYDEIQLMKEEGRVQEAINLYNSLDEKELAAYKKHKSSVKAAETKKGKAEILPVFQEIRRMKAEGRVDEAISAYDALSEDQKRYYQLLKEQAKEATSASGDKTSMAPAEGEGIDASKLLATLTGAKTAQASEGEPAPAPYKGLLQETIDGIPAAAGDFAVEGSKWAAKNTAQGLGILGKVAYAGAKKAVSAAGEAIAPKPPVEIIEVRDDDPSTWPEGYEPGAPAPRSAKPAVAVARPKKLTFSENGIPTIEDERGKVVPIDRAKLNLGAPKKPMKAVVYHENGRSTKITDPKKLAVLNRIKQISDSVNPDYTRYLLKLALAEGDLDPKARLHNTSRKGVRSVDRGIFQINSKAFPQISDAMADDPEFATLWALALIDAGKQEKWMADARAKKLKVEWE